LLGQLSLEAADAVGKSAQNWLGLGDVPASNPVQALLSLPADDFWSKIPPSENFGPVIDGDIIPESITIASWAQTPSWKRTSIEAILVGDSELDVSHLLPAFDASSDVEILSQASWATCYSTARRS
jgi:hypothetical protein